MQTSALVLVLDDDASVRTSLARLLTAAGWATDAFASLGEMLVRADPDRPGCVLMDVCLPGLSGLEVRSLLTSAGYALPVIYMTGYVDVPTTVRAMKEGAVDFLAKPIGERDLLSAVERAVSTDLIARRTTEIRRALEKRWSTLTPREQEVLTLVVSGLLNKQVANQLGTREKTIKVHRHRVMEKMQVKSLAELVHVAHQLGIDSFADAPGVRTKVS